VANYGAKAGGIAIGSTSEAADSSLNSKFSALNWEQFSNDLITAAHFSKIVGVYSLEACVHRGFLAKMKNFNWQQPVHIPGSAITATAHFRAMVQRVIWISTYWIYVLLGLVALIVLLIWQIRKLRKKPAKPV
ncbi:MAG TPA: hypothetical protein VKR32_06405, partial [Puia sp.]|nr:hypothetical protein [Puia sp.]